MATLSFEGETHGEIVQKVKRWLASLEGAAEAHLTPVEAVERGAELTKDALRIVAAAAPAPIAQSDVMRSLTSVGYKATDQTKEAVIAGLDSLAELTGGSLVRRAEGARRSAVYEMNAQIAKQVLRALKG